MHPFQNNFAPQPYSANSDKQPCFGMAISEKQFKRSQNLQYGLGANKQKMSIKEFQFQQKIVLLRIQLKLQSLFSILQPKLLNIQRRVFENFKYFKNPSQTKSLQQALFRFTIEQIVSRISIIVKQHRIKQLRKVFSQLLLRNVCISRLSTSLKEKKKAHKKDAEPNKINSNLDENSFNSSELIDSNYSLANNTSIKNKELRKHHHQYKKKHQNFCEQMDQLLSRHQNFLRKK